jgi:putative transposase
MSDYRHGSHTTFSIHLHIVWITKYRHKVLRGEVAERVRAIVREECQKARVDIVQGHIAPDHVHVMISIPPHVTISRLVQRMKGKSSYRLLAEFPHMRKRFWALVPFDVIRSRAQYFWTLWLERVKILPRGICLSSGEGTHDINANTMRALWL